MITSTGLDLDALEREDGHAPFTFTLGGQEWTAADPEEMAWQDIADVSYNDLGRLLELLLGDAYAEFAQIKLPLWKAEKLAEAIREHYTGLPVGEGVASSAS